MLANKKLSKLRQPWPNVTKFQNRGENGHSETHSPIHPLSGGLKQLLRGAPAKAANVGKAEHSVKVGVEPRLAPLVSGVTRPVVSVLIEVEVRLGPSPPLQDSVARHLPNVLESRR